MLEGREAPARPRCVEKTRLGILESKEKTGNVIVAVGPGTSIFFLLAASRPPQMNVE